MKRSRRQGWESLKRLALGLGLPHVAEATSWGEPVLKAHGKLWVWWSPHEDAPVFKVPLEEREILLEAEPDTFFVTDHYRGHALVLVRPQRLDPEWARANLRRVWRRMAPKRVLAAFDAAQSEPADAAPARRAPSRPDSSRKPTPAALAPDTALTGAEKKKPRRKGRGSRLSD